MNNHEFQVELSFTTGDVIYVIGEVDEDGFYLGELNGAKGLVPSNFLREIPLEEDDIRLGGSWPKGQGRSYLGRAGCQWNGHPEKTTNTQKMQQRHRNIAGDMEEHPRNHTTQQTRDTKGSRHPQGTHHRQNYGTREISKGIQLFEDHIYHQEDKEWLINRHSQEHLQLTNIGNRPAYLHLQGSTNSVKSYDFVSDESRRSVPEISMESDTLPKDSRKGIFSSFKDMFKGPRKI
ncbi:uncharacterized protein TNCV_4652691 [Trichonephila clavipes]|nr:uncharacterized protein TNCV_4652691 [Trichonephila clavipes]